MVQQAIPMSRINAIIVIIAATVLFAVTATAQVPETMSFQGELGSGVASNSTQTLAFRIYTSATGGTSLWNESHSVTLDGRRFNVVLGSSTALSLDFDVQYWIGITVGSGTELSPRVKLTSAPYSLRARDADMAERVADGAITTAKLANGAVTDAKIASGISYSKLSGAPASLPPNGSAGGDLTGSYPNPTIADEAVTTDKIADESVTDAKISGVAWSKITGAPTSLTPGGSAGGDLSGSYPNPTIASDAVTSGKIANGTISDVDISALAGIAYTKLSGAPTSLPPNGQAGGDLIGDYPNPSIASDAVTSGKIADGTITNSDISATAAIAYSKLSGAPTSLPPNGSAGGDLSGNYPDPTVSSVGAKTATEIAASVNTTQSAASANTPSKLVLRDASGNFSAGMITANVTGSITGNVSGSAVTFTGNLNGEVTSVGMTTTIASNAVTSAKISNGTITNDDVSATAGIAYSKLSGTPTSLPPSGAAGGDLTGNYPNPTIATGAVTTGKLADTAVTNAKIAHGISYSKLTGVPTSLPPSGSAGGDLGSTYPNPTVVKLQGRAVASTAPNDGQFLQWNGSSSQWVPGSAAATVPAGVMVIGSSQTAPTGYAYTGNALREATGEIWSTRSSSGFTGRSNFAAVAVNGKIYALGGTINGTEVNTNEEYDPVSNTWATRSSTGFAARAGLAAAAVNGKIYAIGGLDGATNLDTNEEYDPATNTWAAKSSNGFTPRAGLVAAAVNGKIYVIGGRVGTTYMGTNQEYNPATNTWSAKAAMPTTRYTPAAAVVNNKIYVLGGYNGSFLKTNQEYDPAGNSWASKTDMPNARSGLAAAASSGKVYALGGFTGSSYNNINQEYDPGADTWTTKTAYGYGFTARGFLAAVTVNGKIYALGGTTSGGASNANEEYSPAMEGLYLHVKQ